MAYQNQNNSNSQFNNPNVNTNSLTMFDQNSIMLKLSFLDECLSIGIWTPVVDASGKKTYPQEQRNTFVLTSQRVEALYELILYKVIPALKEGRDYNGGVFTSNKKDRVFEILVKEETLYAYLHTNIDENRHPANTTVFEFQKTPTIENYNTTTGDFIMNDNNSGFYLFTKVLDGFLLHISHITTHSFRYANRFTTEKVFDYLKEIALKLGVNVQSNSYGSKSTNGFDSADSGNSSSVDSMPAMETIDDITQILG